jgi:hypothetical protein
MKQGAVRAITSLLVALSATACVPPSCIDRAFGLPKADGLLGLTTFSQPIEEPLETVDSDAAMHARFENSAHITVNTRGRMMVSRDDAWPVACPTMPADDVVEVTRYWQPVLDQMDEPRWEFRATSTPDIGGAAWRPDGPLLGLRFATSGKSVEVWWDGRSHLADSVRAKVLGTLELVCSASARARKYLLRDLPPQVTAQIECR